MDWLFRVIIVAFGIGLALLIWYGVPAMIEADRKEKARWAAYVTEQKCTVVYSEKAHSAYEYGLNPINFKYQWHLHNYPAFAVWKCADGSTHKR